MYGLCTCRGWSKNVVTKLIQVQDFLLFILQIRPFQIKETNENWDLTCA